MSTSRLAPAGKTRICPHCKRTILESATVCPGCNHHLRFDPKTSAVSVKKRAQPAFSALRVEGSFKNPGNADAWEYSVVISVRNDRGEEVAKHVVGVGALQPNEGRTVTLSVDVFTPNAPK
jgi:hypothetical protein